jgi:transposase
MVTRLKTLDRETPLLLPPDLRDWVPQNYLVHFLIDAADALPANVFCFNHRGTGDEQYPPRMMLVLLIYSYATGRFSSRQIEAATCSDVIVRYICGGDLHPDPDTLCAFRRKNRNLSERAFVDVLRMARQLGGLKKVGTVRFDGTRIRADASKHSSVSCKRAGEQADSVPLDDGLSIPEEIGRREKRIERLAEARRIIEERYAAEREARLAEYEPKVQKREERRRKGEKPRGKEPVAPPESPPDKMQHNFTDPESRIMKAGNGDPFEQACNAQAAVDAKSCLIVGKHVTDTPNDKQQLNPILASIPAAIVIPENVPVDTGCCSEKAVGKALCKLRKQTVEPVFGIIKEVMGFRRFSMRRREKAQIWWCLACLSDNVKNPFNLQGGARPEMPGKTKKRARREQNGLLWAENHTFSDPFFLIIRCFIIRQIKSFWFWGSFSPNRLLGLG